jgi:hypothetical protein
MQERDTGGHAARVDRMRNACGCLMRKPDSEREREQSECLQQRHAEASFKTLSIGTLWYSFRNAR